MFTIKKYLNYIGNILSLISIIFIIYTMIRLKIDFTKIKSIPAFLLIGIFGILLTVLTVYGMAFAWKLNLQHLSSQSVCCTDASKIYAKANMAKYMPGNVMHYVERNLFASQIGLSQLDITLSSIIEILGQSFSAVLLSLLLVTEDFFYTIKNAVPDHIILILTGIAFAGMIIITILYYHSSRLQKALHRLWNFQFLLIAFKILFIYSTVLICQGFLFMLICHFVLPCSLTTQQALQVIAFYMLAWVVGFIVPGAPGGIGVREMIIVMLMNSIVGEEIILIAALIHRCISITGDITAYLFSILWKPHRQYKS